MSLASSVFFFVGYVHFSWGRVGGGGGGVGILQEAELFAAKEVDPRIVNCGSFRKRIISQNGGPLAWVSF